MNKFSIMIPVYNQEELVLRALNSIPKRKDIQILIVDDNSIDNSWEVISNWCENNSKYFYDIIKQKNEINKGCGYGKNLMYTLATGDYIVTLDSDDYFLPKINKILDIIATHKEDVIYYGNEVNSGELWTNTDRKATWSYFVKNKFLKDHNLNYDPNARRAGDEYLMNEMIKFNPSIIRLEIVGYHYNYPRKGSIVWNHENRPAEVTEWYKWRTGKDLDIANPKTFNEKIQWLKAYDSTSLKGLLADKYESRKWLIDYLGEDFSIPILGVWDKFDDIDFNKLPNQFVLKATHGSAWNIIVNDKSKFNEKDAKEKFDKWLSIDFGSISKEYHYSYIKPRIIAEEYIKKLDQLDEYKLHCFNGKVKVIKVIKRINNESFEAFYTENWERTTCMYDSYKKINDDLKKPKLLDKMIFIAEKLSKQFRFVRVDFYLLENKFYLGELTFTPCSGVGNWSNELDNIKVGGWLVL